MTSINELLASQNMLALLEEANQHVEALLDDFPTVFVVVTNTGQVIRANQTCCDVMGESLDGALHGDFFSTFNSENKAIFQYHLKQLCDAKETTSSVQFRADVTCTKTQKTQQYIWTIAVKPCVNAAYDALYTIIGKDCSSIYESEVKLTSIFECLPLGILMLDENGNIEEVLTQYTLVLLENSSLKGAYIIDTLPTACEQDKRDLDLSFKRLLSCVGKPMSSFLELESYFIKSISIKSETLCSTKWLKINYQAISKNGLVEKFMIILQDDTESVKVANDRKRIDELERQSKELYECAIRDPLTGLYTRLYMGDGFNTLLDGFKHGYINAVALAIFDIDNFKRINDTYGHIVGDEVISQVGKVILSHSHAGSIAIRYGGDEFLIMLPEEVISDKLGTVFAEIIRAQVEKVLFSADNHAFSVSISGGVINCSKEETIEKLISRADKYLYMAKRSGKNKIMSENGMEL